MTSPTVLVIRPAGYQPVQLTPEEFREGIRMLWANGPLPGMPHGGGPRFILAGADPAQMLKASGYLQFCERITGERKDCWTALNAAGGLDESGTLEVALRVAFDGALQEAARAVRSMTPEQVRAILCLAILGSIVQLVSPDPVTKILFISTTANLIAFIGVDLFHNLVEGFKAMAAELALAGDFAQVHAAGLRYGHRLGPTLARIVVMIGTYGIAKFAGLFKGNALSLPGGQHAASLAEAQGFRIPAAEGARSVALAADGSVAFDLGASMAMAAAGQGGPTVGPASSPKPTQAAVIVKEPKWDYFFGRVRSSPHNQARSLQNAKDLETLGIREAEGGRAKLLKIFEEGLQAGEVSRTIDEFGTTVVRSIRLPGGSIDISYLYRVGSEIPEITSIIPKIF